MYLVVAPPDFWLLVEHLVRKLIVDPIHNGVRSSKVCISFASRPALQYVPWLFTGLGKRYRYFAKYASGSHIYAHANKVSGFIHRMNRKWTKGIQNVFFQTGCDSAKFLFKNQHQLFSEHATNLRLRASSPCYLHAAFADDPEFFYSHRLPLL